MRVLRSIVQVAALAVFDVWHQRVLRHPLAAELVGDEDPRRMLQTIQMRVTKLRPLRKPRSCERRQATDDRTCQGGECRDVGRVQISLPLRCTAGGRL